MRPWRGGHPRDQADTDTLNETRDDARRERRKLGRDAPHSDVRHRTPTEG